MPDSPACRAAIDRRMEALASEDSGPSASVRLYELEQQPIGGSGPIGDAEIATYHGGAALRLAVSCAHGAAADPELEVAGNDREMVGRSDPHVQGTACPTHARASAN